MFGLAVHPGWTDEPDLLQALRTLFTYDPGENRATGYLYGDGKDWPDALAAFGPVLLDDLERTTGVRYTHAAFQAYRDGVGCEWHTDTPFDAQAVLSQGVTRTFGVRPLGGEPSWIWVAHGDLVVMASGFQYTHEHCVPVELVAGERISVVFRTPARS
jgi:alkylated DNA repair dioxygenase AlkB